MEDWHDVVSLIIGSLALAAAIALIVCLLIYGILRLLRLNRRFRKQHTWKSDLRATSLIGAVLFAVAFVPAIFIGNLLSGMCGTSHVTEVPSPDSKHKIVVYNFDCGATTDFSLDVSLLHISQRLPKYRTAELLYGHYHQCPTPSGPEKNFEVQWKDPAHVVVRVEGLDNTAKTKKEDGVEVSFENLR